VVGRSLAVMVGRSHAVAVGRGHAVVVGRSHTAEAAVSPAAVGIVIARRLVVKIDARRRYDCIAV
jgi:hypothetical protein